MPIARNPNEYDYTRLSTYQKCPRKHHYIYNEGIVSSGNQFTTPGSMFHECVYITIMMRLGAIPTADANKNLQAIYDEFDKLCVTGALDIESGTLKYVVEKYFNYYSSDYSKETTLLCESDFEDKLNHKDTIVGRIDQVYERDGLYTLRDIKTTTNKLKYTHDQVKTNQQLLFYVPFAEAQLKGVQMDAVEIDEVRIARLMPVPLMKNGAPSRDKSLLELVTYEDYADELNKQKLFGNPEYQHVLQWLEERGHPLFKRTKVQIVDSRIVDANAKDMYNVYMCMSEDSIKANTNFRVRGPLCNYCEYRELCELDMFDPDQQDRQIYIDKITKTT